MHNFHFQIIDNMHAILFERKMINYSSAATLSKKS